MDILSAEVVYAQAPVSRMQGVDTLPVFDRLQADAVPVVFRECTDLRPVHIHRDVLKNNMFKYTRLLMEAEKELLDVKDAVGKFKADAISTKSIALFIENLKEMLSGCRDSTRFSAQGLNIRFIGSKGSVEAKLINISTTGICVDIGESAAGYKKGEEAAVELGGAGRGRLPGQVVWAGKGPVGIRFKEMDEATKLGLFEFLRDKGEVKP